MVEFSRIILKRTNVGGVIPTVPTGSTLTQFSVTDLFVGEVFVNTVDDRVWVRTDNGILELTSSGSTGGIGTLNQVLTSGNTSGGQNIILTDGDKIRNTGDTAFIRFSSGDTINFKSDNNTDNVTEVELKPDLWGIVHTNTNDGFIGAVFYDGTGQNLYNTVNVLGEDSWGRTIYTPYSVTHEAKNDFTNKRTTVTQGLTNYSVKTISGATTTCELSMDDMSGITLDPKNLSLFIQNLPTSSSGLSSGALFTQTATQLGGSGITKVLCIV